MVDKSGLRRTREPTATTMNGEGSNLTFGSEADYMNYKLVCHVPFPRVNGIKRNLGREDE